MGWKFLAKLFSLHDHLCRPVYNKVVKADNCRADGSVIGLTLRCMEAMMMIRRGIVSLLSVSMVMLILSGCGNSGPTPEELARQQALKQQAQKQAGITAAVKAKNDKVLAERREREAVLNEELEKFYSKQLALANKDDHEAQLAIGLILIDGGSETGQKITRDSEAGLGWVRKAAEAGYAKAQWHLGHRLYKGAGVPKNRKEAFGWFKKSAEGEYTRGLAWMSICYFKGQGVAANDEEAEKWKQMAKAKPDWNEDEFLDEYFAEDE
jgi:hypothetical protein